MGRRARKRRRRKRQRAARNAANPKSSQCDARRKFKSYPPVPPLTDGLLDLPAVQLPIDHHWNRIQSAPHRIRPLVGLRMLLYQFSIGVYFSLFFAILPSITGLGFILPLSGKAAPLAMVLAGILCLLIGLSVGLVIFFILLARASPYLSILKYGEMVQGRITHAYQRGTGRCLPWHQIVKDWAKFRDDGYARVVSDNRLTLRIRLRLKDPENDNIDLELRGDFAGRLIRADADGSANLVVHKGVAIDSEQFPWLVSDRRGRWAYSLTRDGTRRGHHNSLIQSLLIVVPIYLIATLWPWLSGEGLPPSTPATPSKSFPITDQFMSMLIILVFTWTHAVIPVFIIGYGQAASLAGIKAQGIASGGTIFFGFIGLWGLLWFAGPILYMGTEFGWVPFIWSGLHLLFARWGTKRWVLIEYGSTSFALVMYLAMLTPQNPIPFGLIAILGQVALLTFLDLKARPLFVSESFERERLSGN